jgi:hypothetical protein
LIILLIYSAEPNKEELTNDAGICQLGTLFNTVVQIVDEICFQLLIAYLCAKKEKNDSSFYIGNFRGLGRT